MLPPPILHRLRRLARRSLPLLVGVGALAGAAGCVGESEARSTAAAADARVRAVATTGMITDVVRRVGGDRVDVVGLMGAGVDPHLYKARAGDVRRLDGADVIFYNGLHLEAAMGEVFEEMAGRKHTVAVTSDIPHDRLLSPPGFKGAHDPHVWFDVSLWRATIPVVERSLAELDPEGAPIYAANARALESELTALDAWVRARVAELPPERRVLVTAHDAFNYFGRAYGLDVRGLQGINTAAEAGTADVQSLSRFIADRRLPAIFVESSIPRRTVEAVQAAVRARGWDVAIGGSLFSDAMGDAGTVEGTYPGMVRHNVNTIVDALAGSPAIASVAR
ncbi:MAG TPA: zinc ABC transporter substrate-binding protein [Gemmatimonadales bacterium]